MKKSLEKKFNSSYIKEFFNEKGGKELGAVIIGGLGTILWGDSAIESFSNKEYALGLLESFLTSINLYVLGGFSYLYYEKRKKK